VRKAPNGRRFQTCAALQRSFQYRAGRARLACLTIANPECARIIPPDPRRTLPLPDRLVSVLKAAKASQAAERLAVGSSYRSGEYVVSNEVGDPYHPQVLSRYWHDAVKAAGLRPIKLHAARHTAATAMHLSGVAAAVIAAWIGHKDASLTMRLYAHSQDDALKAARDTFNRVDIVVTTRPGIEHVRTQFELGADDGNRTRVFSLGS
jgi:integrase